MILWSRKESTIAEVTRGEELTTEMVVRVRGIRRQGRGVRRKEDTEQQVTREGENEI